MRQIDKRAAKRLIVADKERVKSMPELLSPAGDLERLEYALEYGADAVYVGMTEFGMRTASKNFTPEQLEQGAKLAHAKGKKLYLTMNTTPTNEEIARLPDAIRLAEKAGVDAFIVADLGVLSWVKKYAPDAEIHLSTQVGITNYAAATAAYEMGAKRVVLARELTLQDIAVIRDNTPPELELEAFVHGAMCMSVSGRCMLSHALNGRSANRGECTQPCRWKYHLVEENRPGQYYEIGEEETGTYILNADDLCAAPFLDLVLTVGIDSLKIEGRAKTFYYVASVTSAYRRALDAAIRMGEQYQCPEDVLEELTRTSHRRYSPGFYFGADRAIQNTKAGGYIREWELVAVCESCDGEMAHCTQRGKFELGETLEALTPSGQIYEFKPLFILDEYNKPLQSTPHPKMKFSIPCLRMLPPKTIFRKRRTQE